MCGFNNRYMVYMDENGDAAGNYTILGRRPHHLTPGEFGLYPIGLFTLAGTTPVSLCMAFKFQLIVYIYFFTLRSSYSLSVCVHNDKLSVFYFYLYSV